MQSEHRITHGSSSSYDCIRSFVSSEPATTENEDSCSSFSRCCSMAIALFCFIFCNLKLDNNVLRCAYSKMCKVPWSDMNCDKYDDLI